MPDSTSRAACRRRRTALALAAPALLALAACGDDEVGAKPDLPTEAPPLWNPCDALDPAFVKQAFGVATTKHDGTPQRPECRFTPREGSGGAALTANYQMFSGTLEEFWSGMGQPDDADVRNPTVPGADGARVVVSAEKDQLYVTGFVQNGFLFEVVNVVDPAPYGEARVVAGVRDTLARLTAHADEEGAGQETGE